MSSSICAAQPGVVTCSYCVRLDQGVSQHVTLEAVRGGKFVHWATSEQNAKLRQMHFKSIWYTMIGHPTKPSFRSGNFALARIDYERINGFDEQFIGWGCEDDDFGRRLRAAGVRSVSILNRTRVYHLWHPPAPMRRSEWKQGANVTYLQRGIRLTRCISGLAPCAAGDSTVRLVDETATGVRLMALLATHGWLIEHCAACGPIWSCFAARDAGDSVPGPIAESWPCLMSRCLSDIDAYAVHVVLSPTGQMGAEGQVRLRLTDADALWSVLQGREVPSSRAAA